MARRAFDVIDVVEVLQHRHAGRSKPGRCRGECGGGPGNGPQVRGATGGGRPLAPGGQPLSRGEWVELVRGWFPELIDAKARSLTYPTINAHRTRIKLMLATNTVTTVHRRLRDEHGLAAGISSLRRYVWLELGDRPSPDAVTVWRLVVEPGSEAQIDYGYLGSWFDPAAQRGRRVWAFVMVLACSRHMFVQPVLSMDQRVWVAAPSPSSLPRCAGAARPGQLEDGVIKPDLYDPKINRAYAELAVHYGCLIDPARASTPKDKTLVSHCSSWCLFGEDSFGESAAHAFDEPGVVGGGRLEESRVLVVGLVGGAGQ